MSNRNNRDWRALAVAAACASLYACALSPSVWTSPSADPAASRAELDDCRALALDEMWRMSWERMWPPAFYDPRFMPSVYGAAQPFWLGRRSSIDLEQQLVGFCMHSRGYRLLRLRD